VQTIGVTGSEHIRHPLPLLGQRVIFWQVPFAEIKYPTSHMQAATPGAGTKKFAESHMQVCVIG
jgi:hypothetical protein